MNIMNNTVELAKVPVGKSIKAFGKKFTVLEHLEGNGVLVLSETVEKEMPFLNECKDPAVPNDFRYSDIRRYLNEDYCEELIDNGADGDKDILDMKIDLKCTLGQREYGFCHGRAGLLTLEQYGKYFDIIPKVDCSWWLATPYGTPLRSPNTPLTYYSWSVYTNGGYSNLYCNNSYGVRPALVLDSSLLVSCDDLTEENSMHFSDFSDEELLAEIKRRFQSKENA